MTLLEKPPLPAAAPEELRQWGLAFKGSYIAARQEWLERYGDHIAAARAGGGSRRWRSPSPRSPWAG